MPKRTKKPDTITVQSMPDKIEPALTAEEWARFRDRDGWNRSTLVKAAAVAAAEIDHHDRAIALLNDSLPDSDPRKITRAMLDDLHSCAGWASSEGQEELAERASKAIHALESFLPPDGPTS